MNDVNGDEKKKKKTSSSDREMLVMARCKRMLMAEEYNTRCRIVNWLSQVVMFPTPGETHAAENPRQLLIPGASRSAAELLND